MVTANTASKIRLAAGLLELRDNVFAIRPLIDAYTDYSKQGMEEDFDDLQKALDSLINRTVP